MAGSQSSRSVSRRSFLTAAAGAAAASTLPLPALAASATEAGSSVLSGVRAWYDAAIETLTKAWEPRFRFRQYRRDEPDSADWEGREAPQYELAHALTRLPVLQDEAHAHLVLAATEQMYEGNDPASCAGEAMALDVLGRAERLGYFASDPGPLRFPDLPIGGWDEDDLKRAEWELNEAESCAWVSRKYRGDPFTAAQCAKNEARLEAARERLAGMRCGKIPAFTKAQKVARHAAVRREIVLAYKARLQAAGVDASWVEVPPYRYEDWLAEEVRS